MGPEHRWKAGLEEGVGWKVWGDGVEAVGERRSAADFGAQDLGREAKTGLQTWEKMEEFWHGKTQRIKGKERWG